MKLQVRATAVAALAGGALLIGTPALASASQTTVASCSNPTLTKSTAPAVRASVTITATWSSSTVTVQRVSTNNLKITATAPASGYFLRVGTKAGPLVRVTFRQKGTTNTTRVTVHLGHTDKEILYVQQNVCTA